MKPMHRLLSGIIICLVNKLAAETSLGVQYDGETHLSY